MFNDAILIALFLIPGYIARLFYGVKVHGLKGAATGQPGLAQLVTGVLWGIMVLLPTFALSAVGWSAEQIATDMNSKESLALGFLELETLLKYWALLCWAAVVGLLIAGVAGGHEASLVGTIAGERAKADYEAAIKDADTKVQGNEE